MSTQRFPSSVRPAAGTTARGTDPSRSKLVPGLAARTRQRARDRRRRGAAYVEAILLIMFMTIIFAGVMYLGRYFDAQQRALGIARQCAWAFSRNACVVDSKCGQEGHFPCLPAVCADVFGIDEEHDTELRERVKQAQANTQAPPSGTTDAASGERFRAGVEEKQGAMLELLVGQSVTATASSTIERPYSLQQAEGEIGVGYYLPCNLNHVEPLPMAMDLFAKLL